MKSLISALMILIPITVFLSCKKTTLKRHVYCTKNCQEFSGKIINQSTQKPMAGLLILISEDEKTSGFLMSSKLNNLGYFTTDEQGVFHAKVTKTDFNKQTIEIAVYNYDLTDDYFLATLHQYPDTLTNYYY